MPKEMQVMKIWTSNYLGDSRIVSSNKLQMKGFVARLMKIGARRVTSFWNLLRMKIWKLGKWVIVWIFSIFCVLCFCVYSWGLLLYGVVLVRWKAFPIVESIGVVQRFFFSWWKVFPIMLACRLISAIRCSLLAWCLFPYDKCATLAF